MNAPRPRILTPTVYMKAQCMNAPRPRIWSPTVHENHSTVNLQLRSLGT
jgi:hypothetical protein